MQIALTPDEEGFFGRECPAQGCEGYFKVKPGTGLSGPNLPCFCPYCGHRGSFDTFFTRAQNAYIESVVHRAIDRALTKDLKQFEFEHKPQGLLGIGISMKVQSGPLPPIRYYREQALETEIVCSQCTLVYAVYGSFGFCPDCAAHNSLQILAKNIELARKQLTLASSLPDQDLQRVLEEDALENCVSSFDAFAREACKVRAHLSSDAAAVGYLTFQNLVRAEERMKALFGISLEANTAASDWRHLNLCFQRRHLIAHRGGVVDPKYLAETSDPDAVVGRRVPISSPQVTSLSAQVLALGETLIRLLPPPK